MNPDRWRQLKSIFMAALDKEPVERAAFLDAACGADSDLKREVEELLSGGDRDSFLDKSAREAFPGLFEDGTAETMIGSRLGPYTVREEIGRGGMGVVYLAHDMRLDRPVAIKMLAPQFTRDAQQRERLRREARAAARLSHPDIATVYSLEEFDDSVCIVTEYVRGLTLRQILSKGKLPFDQVLDLGIQTARGMVAAHEEGIVHRDLKPENIILTESGVVKILDFGLARIDSKEGMAADPRLTQSGMFLGTPAYASPEQLLGARTDRNSDIFSFGVMLFEMASGAHPFQGSDPMSMIAHILDAQVPDLTKTNPSIPAGFARIVQRCLNKKASERFAGTRDLLLDLEKLLTAPDKNPAQPSTGPLWWWQFHQACAGFGYYAMLYPLWWVKEKLGGIEGSLLFFPALIAVGIAANLRLHLWFTSQHYVSELPAQRRKVAYWIRGADCLFVFMLAVCAIRLHALHAVIATLLMAVAIGALVAFLLIEPVTARAALDKQ
ncbi:MAG TPA: serine/threonine-protein kinase [Acidobacteriota bacterium]|nr:serine/threonine-protein kinase [Acidobacteriota bacterium]